MAKILSQAFRYVKIGFRRRFYKRIFADWSPNILKCRLLFPGLKFHLGYMQKCVFNVFVLSKSKRLKS